MSVCVENIMSELNKAFINREWLVVKKLNSELADLEVRNHASFFNHKPEVIQIELTSKCNAQCVMCSHYYEFNDCGSEASDAALQKLERLLPYCRLVLLNGYGEPFVSKHFTRCLRLLNEYCVKAIVTTNLSILTDEMCELIPHVFDEINISCNGYSKDTYEKIHRGLRFGTFSNNLTKLVDVCGSAKLSLSCVVMVEIVKWASDIVRFARAQGIRKVRFGRLGVSSFIRNYDQDPTNFPNYVAHHLKAAKRLADEYQIEMIYPENYQMNIDQDALVDETRKVAAIKFRYDEKYQAELRDEFKLYHSQGTYGCVEQKIDSTDIACSGICDWVAKGLYIDTIGDMYTCCESKYLKYDNWNCRRAQSVRNEFFDGRLPDFCKNCPFIINNELKMLDCEKNPALYKANDVISVI